MQELNAVVVSGAKEKELFQLELALNRLAEDSTWNTERLKTKFEQLIEYNVDLTFTGFETAEIDNILKFEVIEPEDQDWTATVPVTQVGDIWQIGDHIIACGNALSPDEVLGGVLDGLELAKACITDPPYNVPTAGHIRTTQKHAEFAMAAGRYYDDSGTGLHIYVRKSGSKSWSQKIRFSGKQLELGLGNYPMVSLAEARRIATENKALAQRGINPKLERVKPKTIPSFKEVMELALPSILDELKNAKHRAQWRTTLETYALPSIGSKPVNEITVNEIDALLQPIWNDKTETASRLRGRIERVLDFPIALHNARGPNHKKLAQNLSSCNKIRW